MEPLNLIVHHKSTKTGAVIRETPYRLKVQGQIKMFEMPKGSGAFFYENGEVVPEEKCPKYAKIVTPLTAAQRVKELEAKVAKFEEKERSEKEAESLEVADKSNLKEAKPVVEASKPVFTKPVELEKVGAKNGTSKTS